MKELLDLYSQKKDAIEKRLIEFRHVWNGSAERVFAELAFCLCTPQSKAQLCWSSVLKLVENGMLYNGSEAQVKKHIKPIRFYNTKARHIILARKIFTENGGIRIKGIIPSQEKQAREWLVSNVKGLGYKEASHFLRNAGRAQHLMILDRHILRNLVAYGVISEVPKAMSTKKYMEIEDKMLSFAQSVGIPASHLDLLFWSKQTGEIFK